MVIRDPSSSPSAAVDRLPVEQRGRENTAGDRFFLPYPTAEIPRIPGDRITAEDFKTEYRRSGLPVILTGLLEHEYPRWTIDFLEQNLGQIVVPVRLYGHERYSQDKRSWSSFGSGVRTVPVPFVDYTSMIRNGQAQQEDAYVGRCSLNGTPLDRLPALEAAEAHLGIKAPVTSFNLWIGSSGHTSCLHYDPMDGTLVQLHGQKHVLLFPPDQTYNLYPVPLLKQLRHGLTLRAAYSQVYPRSTDVAAFPKFQKALPFAQSAVLNPGDILFIPAGWWHELTTLTPSPMVCSINRFWQVWPLQRALTSWNKWRVHLGSLCAAPHIAGELLRAIAHPRESSVVLRTLRQKL